MQQVPWCRKASSWEKRWRKAPCSTRYHRDPTDVACFSTLSQPETNRIDCCGVFQIWKSVDP